MTPRQSAFAAAAASEFHGITIPSRPLAHAYALYKPLSLLFRTPQKPYPNSHHSSRTRRPDLAPATAVHRRLVSLVSIPKLSNLCYRSSPTSQTFLTCFCSSSSSTEATPNPARSTGAPSSTASSSSSPPSPTSPQLTVHRKSDTPEHPHHLDILADAADDRSPAAHRPLLPCHARFLSVSMNPLLCSLVFFSL